MSDWIAQGLIVLLLGLWLVLLWTAYDVFNRR